MSYFDDNEDYIIYGRQRAVSRRILSDDVECRYCGKDGLHWDDGVLMEGRYKVHKCSEADLHAQAADDFEELE